MNILVTLIQKFEGQISNVLKHYHSSCCVKLGSQLNNQRKVFWLVRQLKLKPCSKGFGRLFQHERVGYSQQYFHTTSRRPVNPLLLVFVKFKGLQLLKGLSIVFGRAGRKLHARLPSTVQQQFSRHKIIFSCCLLVLTTIAYYSYAHYDICPLTGRKRWISFTRDQILMLAKMDNEHLLKMYDKKFISADEPVYHICSSLVNALVSSNQDINTVKDINWNLNIVHDDDLQNAFVLPNGEIYLFTGMIHLMSNWEELAIVLGHEMAHAILGHVQEQQSFAVFGELLLIPLLTFIWFLFDDFAAFVTYSIQQYIFPLVFEVGFNLPYSRQLESEADIVGLNLAAKACFDPRWGVLLWDKLALKKAVDDMTKEEGFDIEFMSSHPSHDERATTLESRLSEVIAIREKCNCPKLPTAVDPVLNAHRLRKFVVNIRERTELLNQINEIKSKKESNENTDSTAVATCQKLEERLSVLTLEYKTLLKEESIISHTELKSVDGTTVQQRSEEDDQPSNRWKKTYLWSNIVGSFIDYKSVAPVPTKQTSLITRDLGSNTFGRRHLKRDYYNSFEGE